MVAIVEDVFGVSRGPVLFIRQMNYESRFKERHVDRQRREHFAVRIHYPV